MISLPTSSRFSLAAIATAVVTLALPVNARELSPEALKILQRFESEFVELEPGQPGYPPQFKMGNARGSASEKPVRTVTMNPFSIAKYEVTQELWQAVMGSNPSRWKGPRNSVEMISFDEAQEFCQRVTRMMQSADLLKPNQVIRLPSEAEWEYAARAGTQSIYSFGDTIEELDDYAWHTGNAAGNDPPVGAKKPNAWQLYDIHGYLWEWCADPSHANYQNAPSDSSTWTDNGDAKQRVLRSGSWKDPANKLTSSYRRFAPRTLKDDAVGLRCVRTVVLTKP